MQLGRTRLYFDLVLAAQWRRFAAGTVANCQFDDNDGSPYDKRFQARRKRRRAPPFLAGILAMNVTSTLADAGEKVG